MDIVSIFFNIKVCCVFSLESPHRGESNGYTQYTIFNINKSTASGAKYARSSVIFPHRMAFVRGRLMQ